MKVQELAFPPVTVVTLTCRQPVDILANGVLAACDCENPPDLARHEGMPWPPASCIDHQRASVGRGHQLLCKIRPREPRLTCPLQT